MQKQVKKGFKIDLNAGDTDDQTADEILVLGEKKGLSNSSMIIMLVGFLVIGAVLVWNYYTLNAINKSGSAEMANLSEELNNKISVLSEQLADQKNTTAKKLAEVDALIKAINTALADLTAGKSDKKEMDAAISGIKTGLAALSKTTDTMSRKVNDLASKADSTISGIKKAQAIIQKNRQDIEMLDAKSIDYAALEKALKKEREFNQENMAHATEALFSEIASLQKAVKALNSRSKNAGTTKPSKIKTPPGRTSTDKTGKILEQEIKQPANP